MVFNCSRCGKLIPNNRTSARRRGLCRRKCDGIKRDPGGYPLDPILRAKHTEDQKQIRKTKMLKKIMANRKHALPVIHTKFKIPDRTVFYASEAWQRLRYITLKKYGRKCMVCFSTGIEIHVDHIKPISKFPHLALDPDNLQVLCRPCNLGKSNTDSIDWRPR